MSDRDTSKRRYLAILTLVVLSTVALTVLTNKSRTDKLAGVESATIQIPGQETSPMDQKFDPMKYLPAASKINRVEKDIVFADLDGDGSNEITIFYTLSSGDDHWANVLVLKPIGSDYSRFWEDSYEGSQGFADPTGVYEINKSGKPQIVAYRTIGASCPGILDIYQYANSAIEKITGGWAGKCQSNLEIKDLTGDGTREIAFRDLKYGVNSDIYSWNGKGYVRSNERFPQYYDDELGRLKQSVYSPDALPAAARVTWCTQACKIMLLQKRYSEAIQICRDVLRMIDDTAATKPGTDLQGSETPDIKERVAAYFELEKLQAKEAINGLLGDVQKAAGNSKQAQGSYYRAQELNREAKDRQSKLPR